MNNLQWEREKQQIEELLKYKNTFNFLILDCPDPMARDRLVEEWGGEVISLCEDMSYQDLTLRLSRVSAGKVVHLVNAHNWFRESVIRDMLSLLNVNREGFAWKNPRPIVIYLTPKEIDLFATLAPDFWSWRAGVFVVPGKKQQHSALSLAMELFNSPGYSDTGRLSLRISEIEAFMQTESILYNLYLAKELGKLYQESGSFNKAIKWQNEILARLTENGGTDPLTLVEWHHLVAESCLMHRALKEARQHLQKAGDLSTGVKKAEYKKSSQQPYHYYLLGRAAEEERDFEQAEQ